MVSKRSVGKAPDTELLKTFVSAQADLIEQVTQQAFTERRELFVHEIARRIRTLAPKVEATSVSEGWQVVESLSRLRSIVGGRFENLKARWLGAGFPLKEHRADTLGQISIDENGWIELSSWILTQGFEAKLAPERNDCLFLIRETN